jgi:hypothetical protein
MKIACKSYPDLCALRMCGNTDGSIYLEVTDLDEGACIDISLDDALLLSVELCRLVKELSNATIN